MNADTPRPSGTRRLVFFALKLAVSIGIMVLIARKVWERQEEGQLWSRLADISWGFIALAAVAQVSAIGCSMVRWQRLLVGQGIHAPFRHLAGSFMIGRFFGAFTPGGWTGLNGYRIYDIAKHTGKTARATATIGIEMLLGQLAFGAVVIVGSVFGVRYIGLLGVALVDTFFIALVLAVILLLSRPALFRKLAARLPSSAQPRLRTTLDAVCAYQGKGRLVAQSALLGVGTHACNNLVFVAAAHALGVRLGVGDVFFVSAMQIFATLMPASINGIGLREATAVALYTQVGLSITEATLIPIVGFAVEMAVSSIGGVILLLRPVGYAPNIRVEDANREDLAHEQVALADPSSWPSIARGATLGLMGGLWGGFILGALEAAVVVLTGSGERDLSVFLYGAAVYAVLCGGAGLVVGVVLSWSGRRMQRSAVVESTAFARHAAMMVAFGVLVLGAFRVRRDVFQEQFGWKSPTGILVMLCCLAAAALAYLLVSSALSRTTSGRRGRLLLDPLRGLGVFVLLLAGLFGVAFVPRAESVKNTSTHREKPATSAPSNILFVVVDTLRADHLPVYGYSTGKTPNLDAFAGDSVRFKNAFANASWTRPSFATLLTGRFPSSHRTMAKSDSLPDEIVTLPEALHASGYYTAGVVTNFNVAPFYNFGQGFDEYRYLEPEFPLGANETASKLLVLQFLRQGVENWRAAHGTVAPGSAYRDAEAVNQALKAFFDRAPKSPWMLFVGYMDPHDPYYPHPYDGQGYARAAHVEPSAADAPKLRALYDGEITYWDEQFGRLVADLKRRSLYDDLTIVVTADHGEEFNEHGGFWHGTTLYDEQLRVPVLVKLPKNHQAGTTVDHWVQLVDIAPTLLRLSGVTPPKGMQGGDLFQGTDEVFAEENHQGNVLSAVRTRKDGAELKLIEANPGNPRGLKPEELYRPDVDPGEAHDLAAATGNPSANADLGFAQASIGAYRKRAVSGAVSRKAINVANDSRAVDRLRALGYADDGPSRPSGNAHP